MLCKSKIPTSLCFDSKEHIKIVSSKAPRTVRISKHAKKFLKGSSSKTLYLSIVEPHRCYVWGCSGSTTLLQLQKLQITAARVLANCAFDAASSPSIKSIGWMSTDELISFEPK